MRSWLAFGTGVGIEICGKDLRATVTRVRPSGVQILGELEIPGFREQAAATWGDQYTRFLRELGGGHLAATVILPRDAVIVRQVHMPGVTDRNLANALKFQIDSLHPWPEDEAIWDYARAARTDTVLVGVTRRSTLEDFTNLFAEAGVKIARFTFSAAALQPALRLYGAPPEGFLAWAQNGELELYGESASKPVFSASFDGQPQLAVASALSELRLDPADEPVPIETLMPQPAAAPAGTELARSVRTYAAALTAACPWLAMRLNLLPEKQRQTSARALYVPTITLGSLILITAGALFGYGSIENRRYLETLQAQIRRITPVASRAARLDQQTAEARRRVEAIDSFRLRSKEDMDALNETTRVVAPPAFLTSMNLGRQSVEMSGHSDQAAGLLKLLDSTGVFQNSQFIMPLQRDSSGENFAIRMQRQGAASQ